MKKKPPRTQKARDGRLGFPDVVLYRVKLKDGSRGARTHLVPPLDRPYFIDVIDQDAYEDLCFTNEIRVSYADPGERIDDLPTS